MVQGNVPEKNDDFKGTMPVKLYICDNGDVVVTDLLDWVVPVASALNPTDTRLSAIMKHIKEYRNKEKKGKENVSLYNGKNQVDR